MPGACQWSKDLRIRWIHLLLNVFAASVTPIPHMVKPPEWIFFPKLLRDWEAVILSKVDFGTSVRDY